MTYFPNFPNESDIKGCLFGAVAFVLVCVLLGFALGWIMAGFYAPHPDHPARDRHVESIDLGSLAHVPPAKLCMFNAIPMRTSCKLPSWHIIRTFVHSNTCARLSRLRVICYPRVPLGFRVKFR